MYTGKNSYCKDTDYNGETMKMIIPNTIIRLYKNASSYNNNYYYIL